MDLTTASGIAGIVSGLGDSVIKGVTSYNNYKQQEETQAYNKAVQEKTWEREDNAVIRRAKDLENAGISKNLAAGSAAQTNSPISIGTPQSDYESNMQSKVGQALDSVKSAEAIKQAQQSTDNLKKQNDLLNQQIEAQKLANGQQEFNNLIKQHDWDLLKDTDIMSSDSNLRSITSVLKMLGEAGLPNSISDVQNLWNSKKQSLSEGIQKTINNLPTWHIGKTPEEKKADSEAKKDRSHYSQFDKDVNRGTGYQYYQYGGR